MKPTIQFLAIFMLSYLNLWAQSLEVVEEGLVSDEQLNQEIFDKAKAEEEAKEKDDAPKGADTVEYQSEELQYDVQSKTLELNTKASLSYQGATLNADTISYDTQQMILEAIGAPVIKDKSNPPIAGYKMKYNIKKKLGQVYYGSSYRDNQQFNGIDIRRLEDGRLAIARGDFSSCDTLGHQHYYFYSRRMIIKPKESIVAKPVVLNIADVPIAILPIIVNPLNSGRRSGILMPKYGGDQSQGFFLRDLGYYWAINDYMDWDIRSDVIEGPAGDFDRINAKSNFRYNKRYHLNGNVNGTVFMQDFGRESSGWDLHFNHNQNLRPDAKTTLTGSGSFVSSTDVRQQNGLDRATVLDQQANARLALRHQFDNNATFSLELQQERDLNEVVNADQTGSSLRTTRSIPDAQFSIGGPLIPRSDFAEFDTSSTAAWYEKLNYRYQMRANQHQRIIEDTSGVNDTTWLGSNDRLTLDYNGTLFKVINVTPSINYNGMWSYHEYRRDYIQGDTLRPPRREFDPSQDFYGSYYAKYNASVNFDTKLYGIWRPEIGRFFGIRHTIIPNISYTEAPEIDSNTRFVQHPLIHSSPYQEERKSIGFGLGNDFDLKYIRSFINKNSRNPDDTAKGLQPDYANLKLISLRSNTNYNFAADSLNWSDINSNLGLQITESYRFNVNFVHTLYDEYGPTPNQVVDRPILKSYNYNLNKSFNWRGNFNGGLPSLKNNEYRMTDWSAGLNYSYGFSSRRVSRTAFEERENHSSSANIALHPTPKWDMRYSTNYNFQEGEFAEHSFNFSRLLHCWKLEFRWTPKGPAEGWAFNVHIIDLPDIRLQAAQNQLDNRR